MSAPLLEAKSTNAGRRDRRLIRAALRGDRGAIERLVARLVCVPRFLGARNRRLATPLSEDELADVVQDVLVVAWRKLGTFRGDSALETWLYGVSAIQHRTAVRRCETRATVAVPADLAAREVVAPESARGVLQEALEKLSGPQAVCVRLRGLDEVPFAEIARRLSIPTSTAKTHYYRGLRRLRVLVGPHWRRVQA